MKKKTKQTFFFTKKNICFYLKAQSLKYKPVFKEYKNSKFSDIVFFFRL